MNNLFLTPFLSAILCILLCSGCQTLHQSTGSQSPAISHVVVCWLKDPTDPENRDKLIAGGKSLRGIPGIRRVLAGECLPDNRPEVDSTFDVAFVMEFESEDALRNYENHPLHKKAVRDVLIPLVAKYRVYDFRLR